jgi:hypothetical protein
MGRPMSFGGILPLMGDQPLVSCMQSKGYQVRSKWWATFDDKNFLSSTVTDLKIQCADQEMNRVVIQYSLQCDGLSAH